MQAIEAECIGAISVLMLVISLQFAEKKRRAGGDCFIAVVTIDINKSSPTFHL